VGSIEFVDAANAEFIPAREMAEFASDVLDKLTAGELSSSIRMHHSGGADMPQLFEVDLPPSAEVESHAHDVDEIIFITRGEIQLGKRKYGPGASIFIPQMTLYSFRAGPEGLRFLNFRPCASFGIVKKSELIAERNSGRDQRRPTG
jgi:quercetin dioxygenase-like cupin family protein